MIWATVSSRSCFCWLYGDFPSLAAKNIINLIEVLTVWWYPCIESSLMSLEEGICYDQCIFLAKLCLAFAGLCFVLKAKFAFTPGISWLPTFAFQSPMMKRMSFLGVSSKGLVGLHRTIQLQVLQHNWLRHRRGLRWYWMVCLGNKQRSFCHFWDCTQVLHFGLFCWLWEVLQFF